MPKVKGLNVFGAVVESKIQCLECNNWFKSITNTHLKKHNLTIQRYISDHNLNNLVSLEVRNNISKNMAKEKHWAWIPREQRICACGCEQVFECEKTSERKFINGHNRKGQKQTEKTKKEIGLKNSINYKGKTYEEISGKEKGKLRREKQKQIALDPRVQGKRYTKERNEKISRKRSKDIAEGVFRPNSNNKHGNYVSVLTGNREYYRSSYELERMKQLDAQGIYWTTKHGIIIQYVDLKGTKRRTIPDFLINTFPTKTLEETKNYLDLNGHHKICETLKWCKSNNYSYKVLFKKDLFREDTYERY